jgi:hypothetical protein
MYSEDSKEEFPTFGPLYALPAKIYREKDHHKLKNLQWE